MQNTIPLELASTSTTNVKSYSSYTPLASTFRLEFSNISKENNGFSLNQHKMQYATASLALILSHQQKINKPNEQSHSIVFQGGICRFDTTKKEIYLVFTGHEFADGGKIILNTLQQQKIKASFFFTGEFYRTKEFSSLVRELQKEKHFLGAHSDKHLLYASWEKRDSLLLDKTMFIEDLKNNYNEMKKFGITRLDAQYFLPPYEWYNQRISLWTNELGFELINFTGGTSSNADYTTPDMSNYISSDSIVARILRYESHSVNGLNGFLLLSHIGTNEKRTDKFYFKLNGLIEELKRRGYTFKRL